MAAWAIAFDLNPKWLENNGLIYLALNYSRVLHARAGCIDSRIARSL